MYQHSRAPYGICVELNQGPIPSTTCYGRAIVVTESASLACAAPGSRLGLP